MAYCNECEYYGEVCQLDRKTELHITSKACDKVSLINTPEKQEYRKLHPIDFSGIIGHEDVKQEIMLSVVSTTNQDESCKAYLASIRHHAVTGILLYGLPGVGKSDLLRSIGESVKDHPDIDCKYMSCSDFQGNVGTNAAKIDEIFEAARHTKKKCCIMLIDEIDSVLMKKRGHVNVAERTNAMQSNMDGMKDSSKIIVIGTTNRLDGMEDASKSRFTIFTLELPSAIERVEFIKKYIQPLMANEQYDIEAVVKYTEGFTGRMFRDLGMRLNKIRTVEHKPITAIILTQEIAKYMRRASRNTNQVKETNDNNSLNDTNVSFNNIDITYKKRASYTLDSDAPKKESLPSNPNELIEQLKDYSRVYTDLQGADINSSNIIGFSMDFCKLNNPKAVDGTPYTPSMIQKIASRLFKLTPGA